MHPVSFNMAGIFHLPLIKLGSIDADIIVFRTIYCNRKDNIRNIKLHPCLTCVYMRLEEKVCSGIASSFGSAPVAANCNDYTHQAVCLIQPEWLNARFYTGRAIPAEFPK